MKIEELKPAMKKVKARRVGRGIGTKKRIYKYSC